MALITIVSPEGDKIMVDETELSRPPDLAEDIEWTSAYEDWTILLGNIDLLKRDLWEKTKRLRDFYEDQAAMTPFGLVQCDDRSKIKINGLVQMAVLAKSANQPFLETFTMYDNSLVELDADETIQLGLAVGAHVSAVHAKARQLRDLIRDATTSEELDAIEVEFDWPGQLEV